MRVPVLSRVTITSGLVLVLGATLVYQILAPIPEYEIPRTAPRPVSFPALARQQFLPPQFAEFSEIDEHPLFVPGRLPIRTRASLERSQRVPPQLTLIGIILDASRKIAILKPSGAATVYLTPGETFQGWHVAAIEPDFVEMESGGETFKARLPRPTPPSATPPPARPPPQTRAALPSAFSTVPNNRDRRTYP